MNNSKRIITLAVALVLFFAGQAMSQTKVLGLFQLGKTTYEKVKADLPKGISITSDEGVPTKSYGGPTIMAKGVGYDIDGLKVVRFDFDRKQILVHVSMNLEEGRSNDIKKILSSKYQQIRSYPGVWLLFKANRNYVCLYLPRDKNCTVEYMTGTVYRQEQLRERQTFEYNKKYERENKKALEREAEEEAAKF